MIILSLPGAARHPFCTGIIFFERVRRNADPFFFCLPEPEGAPGGSIAPDKDKTMTETETETGTSPQEAAPQAKRPARRPAALLQSRKRVVTRLWKAAERQVEEIEARVEALGDDPQALERDAKTLAIIAKTIRDLVAIDIEARPAGASRNPKGQAAIHGVRERDEGGADFGPRDIEGFRAELARRLDQLRREGAGGETP